MYYEHLPIRDSGVDGNIHIQYILFCSFSFFPEVNGIYAEYFPSEPPARATFAVAGLPAGGLVEIDCIAIA
jgi:2-iminobutanoate/2-iminopropanoate deaminase